MRKVISRNILVLVLFIVYIEYLVPAYALHIDIEDTVTGIQDGDTFYIAGESNGIRLADISATDNQSDPKYLQAKNILSNLLPNGKTVYLDTDPVKSYERWVAVVYIKHSCARAWWSRYTNFRWRDMI